MMIYFLFFFFKQKTAYEMRISDWSSDVCSSDLDHLLLPPVGDGPDTDRLVDRRGYEAPAVRREGERVDGEVVPRDLGQLDAVIRPRSEERSVGKECVCTCRYRWSPYKQK